MVISELFGPFSNSFTDHLSKQNPTMSAITHTSVPAPTSNGHTNGHSSTHTSDLTKVQSTSSESHLIQTKRREESFTSRTDTTSGGTDTFTSDQNVTVLRQTVITTRTRFISELSHVNAHYIDSMSMDNFLEYIERDRLTHMPQRGSRWDNVLKCAEFFALQISYYENAVHSFVTDSKDAANMIRAASCVLIEVSTIFIFRTMFAIYSLYKNTRFAFEFI